MRIAFVSSGYLPALGGVEVHVAEIATRMASAGHEVDVLTQTTDPLLPSVERRDGVTVRRSRGALVGRFVVAPGLGPLLLRHRPPYELIHAQNYHALPALAAAAQRASALVFTPHYLGSDDNRALRTLHALYRPVGGRIFQRAERIVCVTSAEAAMVREDFDLRAPVVIIPNGIDVVALRSAEPYAAEGITLLSACRLEPYKNVASVIRALEHLDAGFRVVVAGDGPDRPRLVRLAADLGVESRVRFVGRLVPAQLHRWMRSADVYVTLSPKECFNITALEALTAGCAVVASDIEVHREVLGPRHTAFVPSRIEPAPLAAAIRDLARRPHDAPAVARVATWDDVAAQHEHLYQSVLKSR